MEPSAYLRECERLRHQIADEPDLALRREMEKTYKHFHKQARAASKHHRPWYGMMFYISFFAILFLAIVALCDYLEKLYGWGNTTTAIIAAGGLLILAVGVVFTVKKILSSDQFMNLTQTVSGMFTGLRGGNNEGGQHPTLPSSPPNNQPKETDEADAKPPSLPSGPLHIEADSDSEAQGD